MIQTGFVGVVDGEEAGEVGGVAGGAVDDRDAGVFGAGGVDLVGGGVDGDADGAEPGFGGGAGWVLQPVVWVPLQVAPLTTETAPGPSPLRRSAT